VPGLAIAGSLAGARVHVRTRATLDTAGLTFVVFLLGVILIVGALIYFPMSSSARSASGSSASHRRRFEALAFVDSRRSYDACGGACRR
jgi:hypothetical protein